MIEQPAPAVNAGAGNFEIKTIIGHKYGLTKWRMDGLNPFHSPMPAQFKKLRPTVNAGVGCVTNVFSGSAASNVKDDTS